MRFPRLSDFLSLFSTKIPEKIKENFPSSTLYVPEYSNLEYNKIREYYYSTIEVRRVINSMAKLCLFYGTNQKNEMVIVNKQAELYLINLLLFGFLVVDKTTKDVLLPEYCEFFIDNVKTKKLVGIRYLATEPNEVTYGMEELAFISFESLGTIPCPSPLDGIQKELETNEFVRQIMRNFHEKGAPIKLALLLDKGGLTPEEVKQERLNIADSIMGGENAGRPLVAFSKDAKGQITELKGSFVNNEYMDFSDFLFRKICLSVGLPAEYVGISAKGSGLSDSRAEIADSILDYTIKNLQELIELLYKQLEVDFKFNEFQSKVKLKILDLDIKEKSVENQKELLLGKSNQGNLEKDVQNPGRPTKTTREKL